MPARIFGINQTSCETIRQFLQSGEFRLKKQIVHLLLVCMGSISITLGLYLTINGYGNIFGYLGIGISIVVIVYNIYQIYKLDKNLQKDQNVSDNARK